MLISIFFKMIKLIVVFLFIISSSHSMDDYMSIKSDKELIHEFYLKLIELNPESNIEENSIFTNYIRDKKITLKNKNLISIPAEIGKLRRLTKLDLGCNKLRCLPEEIGKLSRLVKLEVHANKLTTLPVEIGNLSALQCLFLQFNQLITLPKEIGKLTHLKELSLCYNKLILLPPEISNLTNLNTVWLYNCSVLPRNHTENVWKIVFVEKMDNFLMYYKDQQVVYDKCLMLSHLYNSFSILSCVPRDVINVICSQLYYVCL